MIQKAPYPYLLNNKIVNFGANDFINHKTSSKYESIPQRLVNNAAKSAASLFLVGNRLGLIHKHLASASSEVSDKTKLTQLLNKYVNNYSLTTPLSSSKPS